MTYKCATGTSERHVLQGVAIAGMVFQILSSLTSFGAMSYGFLLGATLSSIEDEHDIDVTKAQAILYTIGVCGLVLFIVFIWASVKMCGFVGCCGQGQQKPWTLRSVSYTKYGLQIDET